MQRLVMKQRQLQSISLFICFTLINNLKETSTQNEFCDPDIPSRLPPVHHPSLSYDTEEEVRNCSEGEYLEWYWCSPCPDGTFRTRQMSLEDKYSRCHECHTHGMYEVIAEPCTRTRDSKIMCEDGFYRYKVPGKPCQSYCVLCDVCGVGRNMFKNFVGRECGEYSNTVCCVSPDMVVVNEVCVVTIKSTTSPQAMLSRTSSTSTKENLQDFTENGPEHFVYNNPASPLKLYTNLQFYIILIILASCYDIARAMEADIQNKFAHFQRQVKVTVKDVIHQMKGTFSKDTNIFKFI